MAQRLIKQGHTMNFYNGTANVTRFFADVVDGQDNQLVRLHLHSNGAPILIVMSADEAQEMASQLGHALRQVARTIKPRLDYAPSEAAQKVMGREDPPADYSAFTEGAAATGL